MVIIQLRPNQQQTPRHTTHRRRCSFATASLHVYRRVLRRRIGLTDGGRPACVLDTLARTLLQARAA